MQKIKLGILSGDVEYRVRLVNCLMNHFKSHFEIHVFSNMEQWKEQVQCNMDLILLSDLQGYEVEELIEETQKIGIPLVELYDVDQDKAVVKEGVYRLDKYQEVNLIVEEILKQIGEEIKSVQDNKTISRKTRITAIYALSENEYQLPFIVTMASILSENEKVLILDLQENSGFTHFISREDHMSLEEVLVMAEGDNFSKNRLLSCIGHMEKVDYVYPVSNTECLSEADAKIYMRVLQMLIQEMDYSLILLNLGTRFQGFFEVLNQCQEVYLMQKKGGLAQWREFEFMEELENKGYHSLLEKISKVDLPIATASTTSCERLVEQWKWSELGDMIRRMNAGVAQIG